MKRSLSFLRLPLGLHRVDEMIDAFLGILEDSGDLLAALSADIMPLFDEMEALIDPVVEQAQSFDFAILLHCSFLLIQESLDVRS